MIFLRGLIGPGQDAPSEAAVSLVLSCHAGQSPVETRVLHYLRFIQSPPEFITGEVVHEWVEAAVQAGEAEGHRVAPLDQVLQGAVIQFVGFCQEVQGQGDVVRCKAQQEDDSAA